MAINPDAENVKSLILQTLNKMLEPSYKPDSRWGICRNASDLLDEFLPESLSRVADQRLFTDVVAARIHLMQHIEKYAFENKRNRRYPIENSGVEYRLNDHKWEGEWLDKRRNLLSKVLNFVQSNDSADLIDDLPTGN